MAYTDEEKVDKTKGFFKDSLANFTTWTQVINYLKDEPQAIKTATLDNLDADIARQDEIIAFATQQKTNLQALKDELEQECS